MGAEEIPFKCAAIISNIPNIRYSKLYEAIRKFGPLLPIVCRTTNKNIFLKNIVKSLENPKIGMYRYIMAARRCDFVWTIVLVIGRSTHCELQKREIILLTNVAKVIKIGHFI